MKAAKLPDNEKERLLALKAFEILDSEGEQAFDDLTQLAAAICDTPISLVSLVDEHRQWFKSRVGLDASETERELAFCAHAIHQEQVFEVPNALKDDRFHDNPLVTGAPDIRFYAGAPLATKDGYNIGTLCVIDKTPKELTDEQRNALKILARQVVSQMELRLKNRNLEKLNQSQEVLLANIAHDLKGAFNGVVNFSEYLEQRAEDLEPKRIQQISRKILRASTELYQILDQTVQWSQKQLGALKPKREKINLLTLLNQTVQALESSIKLKDISIDKLLPTELEVKADKVLTAAVIRNLLANAVKYSPDSGIVKFEASQKDKRVQLSITNQGETIPPEIVENLFQPLLSESRGSAGEQGHGIGLSIAKSFCEMQGIDIEHDADFKDGVRFRLVFAP